MSKATYLYLHRVPQPSDFVTLNKDRTFLMRSHKTRSTRDRSIPRSFAKMSFDEILDLPAHDFFSFYNNYWASKSALTNTTGCHRAIRAHYGPKNRVFPYVLHTTFGSDLLVYSGHPEL